MQTIVIDYLRIFLFLVECPKYKNLTEADRKYGHGTSGRKCDDNLDGWHRFQGDAGREMMTRCPSTDKCGGSFSAWLSDGHPTVAEGIAQKKVCIRTYAKDDGHCCNDSFFIKVKNCGSYFIYKLAPCQGTCPFRYCGTD